MQRAKRKAHKSAPKNSEQIDEAPANLQAQTSERFPRYLAGLSTIAYRVFNDADLVAATE